MKNKLLFICFILCAATAFGQSFEWAKRAGLYSFDLGYGVATDGAGNVYIAGKYEKNAYFGGTYVTCEGNHDIYIAKYGPDGSFKWVRTAGGISGDYAHAIACDAAGNCYITGEIERAVKFGSVSMTGNGGNDVFVAKYNTNGTLLWAKKLGGSNQSDKGLGIAQSNGSIYVTGYFKVTANFAGTYLTSAGLKDIFIAKYTSDGVFQWVKKAGGPGDDEGAAVTADAGGNVYITGYYSNTANFGGPSITSKGSTDIFIAKYNSSGTCIWARSIGERGLDNGHGIAADNSGRIFLTGAFRHTTYFGSTALTSPGGKEDIFVACYNSSGNAVWAKKSGGNLNDRGRALAIDKNSNVYITGNYCLNASFGTKTIYGVDSAEIFFASYDAAGNFRWVLNVGGEKDAPDPNRYIEMGLSISADPFGNVFGSGAYRSASSFGGTTLPKWDHTEVYVTKIRQAPTSSVSEKPPGNPVITPSGNVSFCTGGSVLLSTAFDSAYQYLWKKNDTIISRANGASYKASAAGTYKVMIINGEDTLSSEPTTVTESKSITATITPPGPIGCKDTVTLKANTGNGYIFQWKRNGIAIPGATSANYTPDRSGDYQVKIIQGSCIDWSAPTKVTMECPLPDSVLNSRSMNVKVAADDSLFVMVYPNPNNGLFTLEINMAHAGETEKAKIELSNAIGQTVYQKIVSNNKGNIREHVELESTMPTGVYFLHITVGDNIETTRMMLTK